MPQGDILSPTPPDAAVKEEITPPASEIKSESSATPDPSISPPTINIDALNTEQKRNLERYSQRELMVNLIFIFIIIYCRAVHLFTTVYVGYIYIY